MKYLIRINNKEYEVEVERGRANLTKTMEVGAANPELEPVVMMPVPVAPTASASFASVPAADGEPIKAPMPGTILEVKAGVGTTVRRGDVVLILEAMKMENEICAPRDGKIAQIVAAKGAFVTTDEILMILL
jgi:glutaconyl-CoA/methylmalonyl-CoA decarboxylase subunit gamma